MRIKVAQSWVVGWSLLAVVSSQAAEAPSPKHPKNQSSIVIEKGICKGHLPADVSLNDIGINADALAHGVECVAADFDGNGFLDFAIFGSLSKRLDFVPSRRIRVILFKEDRVILNDLLEGEYEKLVLYGPTSKEGTFGEPATSYPGLVDWGEGGTTRILLYDADNHHFVLKKYHSEHDIDEH